MSRPSSTGPSRGRAKAMARSRNASARSARAVRRSRTKAGPRKTGRILHLDAFSGIAGNMFLAALLDLGLSRRELESDLAGLGVEHALRVRKVRRGALAARYLEVRVPGALHREAWARCGSESGPLP